jgi:squalene monooxygenase
MDDGHRGSSPAADSGPRVSSGNGPTCSTSLVLRSRPRRPSSHPPPVVRLVWTLQMSRQNISIQNDTMSNNHYDVVIVGAGIAGSALAHALATLPRPGRPASPPATSSQASYDVEPPRPLRVCVLERSLAEPDRIVGELLQPGGMRALKALGLENCTEDIDAVPVKGYAVVKSDELVEIPYPAGAEGRSFHHGRFVNKLRTAILRDAENGRKGGNDVLATLDVVEATVQELVECEFTHRVIGVRAVVKTSASLPPTPAPVDGPSTHPPPADDERKETFFSDLVVVADGCFSNFRTQVLGPSGNKPSLKSHFVGLILEDVTLPLPHHGTVCLVKNSGPVLLYQIAGRDTRILIDVKAPLPSDLKVCLSYYPPRHISQFI